ncbi:methyltransferase [Actinomadura sp. NPDC048032]|uniref:methyltransferase n=1 Tax=Actinomadura sp. NPDC048032 TaxID=3155747 RepID=UPI0033FE9762
MNAMVKPDEPHGRRSGDPAPPRHDAGLVSAAADEAVPALWAMAQLATPMAVRVAATLRIADHIAAGLRTVPELAAATGADAGGLARLMRYLAVRGVLTRDDSDRYGLTALGEPLRGDHPGGLRACLDVEEGGRAELCYVELLHSVRTGEPAYPRRFGLSFWDDLAAEPRREAAFRAMLRPGGADRARRIASAYDWASLGRVVDVGGGDGTLLAALLTAHPGLRGVLVERPPATDAARKALAAAGVADRAEVETGDMFGRLPPGAGGYVLSLIVHNWGDDPARAILARCAEAAGADGSVFVVENVGPDGAGPTGLDLRMLAYCGGKVRSLPELSALAAEAGLGVASVHPAGAVSIVELHPGG